MSLDDWNGMDVFLSGGESIDEWGHYDVDQEDLINPSVKYDANGVLE